MAKLHGEHRRAHPFTFSSFGMMSPTSLKFIGCGILLGGICYFSIHKYSYWDSYDRSTIPRIDSVKYEEPESYAEIPSNFEDDLSLRRKHYGDMIAEVRTGMRSRRLPDVIISGIRKCGTLALRTFISFHPMIKYSDDTHYYDFHLDQGLNYYLKKLPSVTRKQILMDRSPEYFMALPHELPDIIYRDQPNVKLLMIMCNPVDRALSDYAMRHWMHEKVASSKTFEIHLEKYLPRVRSLVEEVDYSDPELPAKVLSDLNESVGSGIFSVGLYPLLMKRWTDVFNSSHLLAINGEQVIVDPGPGIERLQDFLGIPRIMRREDFVKHPTTGMFCVRPWWSSDYDFEAERNKMAGWEERLVCLQQTKGRSRSKTASYSMAPSTRSLLSRFYEPFNRELYKMLGTDFHW